MRLFMNKKISAFTFFALLLACVAKAGASNGNIVPANMVLIKAGTFIMGSPVNEKGRDDDENQHQVTISAFYRSGKGLTSLASVSSAPLSNKE
jgi:formylglycine-generating enzyme required for sulfatase activity